MPDGKFIINNNQIVYGNKIKIPTEEQFNILLSAPIIYYKNTYRTDVDLVDEMQTYTYEQRTKHYYYSTPKLPTAEFMLWYCITQTASMSLKYTGSGNITPLLSIRTYINTDTSSLQNIFLNDNVGNTSKTVHNQSYYTMRYFDNKVYTGYKNVSDKYTDIIYNTTNVASYIDIQAIQAYPQYTPVTIAHVTIDTVCQYIAIDNIA